MIICPSCNHQNPEGSLQCENCYTPLPATTSCPNCGASVQTDATFCGQCGFNLQAENPSTVATVEETPMDSLPELNLEDLEEISLPDEIPISEASSEILPETAMSSFIPSPWDDDEEEPTTSQDLPFSLDLPEVDSTELLNVPSVSATESVEQTEVKSEEELTVSWESDFSESDLEAATAGVVAESTVNSSQETPVSQPESMDLDLEAATQIQIQTASLLHLQSNTTIELPSDLDVVHLGKPNTHIPPDIDVSGFPDSEVVSRVHADIRIEGDVYYLEDTGSSNGTYINHTPLLEGNRHRLRPGDRIALGKGDLVTFIFQLS
ncbi:FHA domain-containing protein [Pleurocapsales cyanobacterium LEGE 10410]|nr:FHA domain-containing protein [Pleurocapsales cyanobacterium LEGE 10410]